MKITRGSLEWGSISVELASFRPSTLRAICNTMNVDKKIQESRLFLKPMRRRAARFSVWGVAEGRKTFFLVWILREFRRDDIVVPGARVGWGWGLPR